MAGVFKKKWKELLAVGKLSGKAWAKKRKVDLKKQSEEELYELVEKAKKG